jgi:transposase-like protein
MKVIRYSKGFKLQMVSEVESGKLCSKEVERKYDIKGNGTVTRWVRQFGSGKYGKVIRVEKAGEVNEASRLRGQLRQVKEALADAHVDLALEKAFLEMACEELNQPLEAFKKKHAGGRRARRSRSTPTSK